MPSSITLRAVGGPTALLELGGLRLLTDPTFDGAGSYVSPSGSVLTKTTGPALPPDELGRLDAVLLSHDQHPDNLDRSGRALLPTVPVVLSTPSATARLGGTTRALTAWEHTELLRPGDAPALRITGVPARHGPAGCESVCGEVTGFVLTAPDLPTVYISGDNASLGAVRQVADRFGPVDVAVIFAGGARTGVLDGALLTLDSDRAAEAARILGAGRTVPLHCDGWQHFTEGRDDLRTAFDRAGLTDRLVLLTPGQSATL